MAKIGVHTASREELVEAGVPVEIAEEILKLRSKIESFESGTRIASVAAHSGLQAMRRTIGAAAEIEQKILSHASSGAAELTEAFVGAFNEQIRDNLNLAAALPRAADWNEAVQLQREFVQTSFERLSEFNSRYLKIIEAVLKRQLDDTIRTLDNTITVEDDTDT